MVALRDDLAHILASLFRSHPQNAAAGSFRWKLSSAPTASRNLPRSFGPSFSQFSHRIRRREEFVFLAVPLDPSHNSNITLPSLQPSTALSRRATQMARASRTVGREARDAAEVEETVSTDSGY
jgi:hypothetical protein